MTAQIKWIDVVPSAPAAGLFGGTRGQGSPIVIDQSTDTAYYLKSGTPTPLTGGGGGGSELPVGTFHFSNNTTNPNTTLGYGVWSLVMSGYLTLTP